MASRGLRDPRPGDESAEQVAHHVGEGEQELVGGVARTHGRAGSDKGAGPVEHRARVPRHRIHAPGLKDIPSLPRAVCSWWSEPRSTCVRRTSCGKSPRRRTSCWKSPHAAPGREDQGRKARGVRRAGRRGVLAVRPHRGLARPSACRPRTAGSRTVPSMRRTRTVPPALREDPPPEVGRVRARQRRRKRHVA